MRLLTLGGAGDVTGSLHLLMNGNRRILLDCGLFQGPRAEQRNARRLPFSPAEVDLVVISHAHLDHCGRLPILSARGFSGPVLMTPATADLCRLMLTDAAGIEEGKARGRRRPLFTERDVRQVMEQVQTVPYEKDFDLGGGIEARFGDAGHILGSAFVRVSWKDDQGQRVLLYSGDLGRAGMPLLEDPAPGGGADTVVLEATYGDRDHPPRDDESRVLSELAEHVAREGGNLVIPAFAIGRTQELLYVLDQLEEEDRIPGLPVICDSPLAIRASEVFRDHPECWDERAGESLRRGDDPLWFSRLEYSEDPEESRRLNDRTGVIIIAGSGMAEGGRVTFHLLRHLERPESAVLFAGYQARGTLGRRIVDGQRQVRIGRSRRKVRCRVCCLSGMSAHADRTGLLRWVGDLSPKPERIVLVHGEDRARRALARDLAADGTEVVLAREGEAVDV